eukprot:GHVP01017531.1.p1 GENE.GHVP01017531.1~~GHVP01017531.1.p1  ORF type:complete len:105 (-),score=15.28 GHVP01017531.1:303-617(-)
MILYLNKACFVKELSYKLDSEISSEDIFRVAGVLKTSNVFMGSSFGKSDATNSDCLFENPNWIPLAMKFCYGFSDYSKEINVAVDSLKTVVKEDGSMKLASLIT